MKKQYTQKRKSIYIVECILYLKRKEVKLLQEIERFSLSLIDEAISSKATDIHFLSENKQCLIFYRLHGRFEKWKELKPVIGERLISHLKYRSGMDIGEKRKPQSSAMQHRKQSSIYSLRLSTLPNRDKESLVIRILPHTTPYSITSLSILPKMKSVLDDVCSFTNGLCLFSGPTGSGKSTTMYALIEQITQRESKSVITIEDPVERPLTHVVQAEINLKAGLTYETVLRASLRHDPDVILIGEIRDEITASLAIRASLTGHLVLATVHANTCYSAIMRMMNLGVDPKDLAECCRLVSTQQLVTTYCWFCDGECSILCKKYRQKARGALFSVLRGQQLATAIEKQEGDKNEMTKQAKKAWALGFLSERELWRFLNG